MPEILQRKQGQSFYDLCEEKMQTLPEERQFLKEVLQNKKSFLEIGAGYSTLWCSQFVQRVVSVEARKPWFEEIESYLKKCGISNVELHLLPPELCAYYDDGREKWNNRDIPEGSDYGFTEEFIGYLEGIERLLDNNHFDVVLVDGHVRKQIIEMLIRKKFDGVILLHDVMPERDYLNRPILALNGVKIIRQVKTLGELAVAPYKLEVGGQRYTPGWITTDKPQLDVTNVNDWRKWFKPISIKTIFAEHILEHLSLEETECFFESTYEYLCEGGRIRIAVPDALHPSAWYHKSCKPGGLDLGSDDHKYFFSCKNIYKFFDPAKYDIRLLEWWDEEGFHKAKWQNDDTHGKVMRSSEYYDGRITKSTELQKLLRDSTPEGMRSYYSQYGITYTSLIFELVKKEAELTVLHGHSKSSGKVNISNGPYPVTIKTTDERVLDVPQLPTGNSSGTLNKIIGFCITKKDINFDFAFKKHFPWLSFEKLRVGSWFVHLWGHGSFAPFIREDNTTAIIAGYTQQELNMLGRDRLENRGVFIRISKKRVEIENDTIGSFRVFYGQGQDNASIASVEDLVLQSIGKQKVDKANFVQFLLIGHLTGKQTIYPHVFTMEANSILRYSDERFETQLLPPFQFRTSENPVADMYDITVSTIRRYSQGYEKMFLPLSGGYDSRLIAACVEHPERIIARTYGYCYPLELCSEVAHAKLTAKAAGISNWHEVDLGQDFFADYGSLWFDIFGTSHHLHGMYVLSFFDNVFDRELTPLPTLSGYIGDAFAGNQLAVVAQVRDDDYLSKFRKAQYHGQYSFSENELKQLLNYPIDELLPVIYERWQKIRLSTEGEEYQRFILNLARQKGRSHVSYLCTIADLYGAAVTPYTDRLYIETILGLPYELLLGRKTQEQMLRRYFPSFVIDDSQIPEINYAHDDELLCIQKRKQENLFPVVKEGVIQFNPLLRQQKLSELVTQFNAMVETSSQQTKSPSLKPLYQLNLLQPIFYEQSKKQDGDVSTQAIDIGTDTNKPLRVVFLNTYYPEFLTSIYQKHTTLLTAGYNEQHAVLRSECFGDSDFYSEGLKKAGWDATDLIINCSPLQQAWALENDFSGEGLEIAIEQIRRKKPEVVYLQNLSIGTADFLSAIRPYTELIVGQIACPVPACADLHGFDIIFSSLPHFVERFRKAGITSYYQPLAFEPTVLKKIPQRSKKYAVTFVGGMSPAHGKGQQILEELSELVPIDCWGYGAESLPENSPIRQRHHGESWGLEMFSCLRQSTMTINRHIDVAENNANNMRLFEATGCGAMLITDYKDNLNELFEIGKEVVAYRSPEEAAALIKYYSSYPEEAEKISHAGRQRTLTDHTYAQRMKQTAEILSRHLRYRQEKNRFTAPDMSKISCGFSPIQKSEICESLTTAWQSEDIPAKQRALTQQELEAMYKGTPPTIYQVLADCIKEYATTNSSILEIGCSSGYYYEILEYLLNKRIAYTGVDYSEPLISMAKDYYPNAEFFVADGANMPFDDGWFHIAISSCILLHVPNYQEHIAETARVAKDFVVAHRTPICRRRPTQYFKKFAYGVETVELRFNEDEILSEFASNGLKLIKAIEYYSNPQKDSFEVTYLFKKTITHNDIIDNKVKRFGQADYTPSPTKFKNGPVVLVSRDIAFTFPLSYAYLAGYLKEKDEDVRILLKDPDHNELIRQIMELNPVLVGFGSLYPELKETHDIIRLLDKAGRQFPIVIGGQMVSPTPEFAVKVTGADFGVIGEGEIILHQLVTALRQGHEPADVKGLVVRQGDEFLSTGPGEFIEDLSKLPPVPYELFPQEKWLPIGRWYAEHCPQPHWKIDDRVINVHGGRGCPYKCNFCYHHSRPRYRPIPLMIAEVAEALERFNGNMLAFSDDLVLANPKRARQLVGAIEALNRHVEYAVSARFDILARIDDDLLYEMKKTGCRTMGLGIESGSDRILKLIGKNCTADTVRSGLARLKKFGILPTVSIMVGQYTETREDAEASIELMRESIRSNPDIQYAFTITTPFPGSQLYDLIFQKGYLRSHQEFYDIYFSTGREFQQVVNLSEMSSEEVLEIHKRIAEIYMEEKAKACDRKLIKQVNYT